MKNLLLIVLVLLLLGGGAFYAYNSGMLDFTRKENTQTISNSNSTPPKELLYNMEYTADGEKFSIQNGMGASPDGNTLKIVDQPVFGDLNKDGKNDAALWLLKETPGDIKEYYATVSINNGDKYKSEDSVLLGTNLTPENIVIVENQAVYQYENQNNNTTTQNQTTITYDTNNNQLGTAPNIDTNPAFTGNTNAQELADKDWQWINTTYSNELTQIAVPLTKLALRLDSNGTFAASTDCSGIGGRYEINNNDIVFSEMPGTLLYCGGIEDKDFRRALKDVVDFEFNSKGNLLLNLKDGTGIMNFK